MSDLTELEQLKRQLEEQARTAAAEAASAAAVEAATSVVKEALRDIPGRDEVLKMIKEALREQEAEWQKLFNSVDIHLRNVEAALNTGLGKIESAASKISATAEVVDSQVDHIRDDIEDIQNQVRMHSQRLSRTEGQYDELNKVIFGDTNQPHRDSVFGRFDAQDQRLAAQQMELAGLRSDIQIQIKPLADWINLQRRAWRMVWDNKAVRYVILSTLLGALGFNFANNLANLLGG